jgi:hypothetical protein
MTAMALNKDDVGAIADLLDHLNGAHLALAGEVSVENPEGEHMGYVTFNGESEATFSQVAGA